METTHLTSRFQLWKHVSYHNVSKIVEANDAFKVMENEIRHSPEERSLSRTSQKPYLWKSLRSWMKHPGSLIRVHIDTPLLGYWRNFWCWAHNLAYQRCLWNQFTNKW